MINNQKPTWKSVYSTNPNHLERVEGQLGFEDELNRVCKDVLDYLYGYGKAYCDEMTLTLSMQESQTNRRLMRGTNEEGYIEPDFGKPFQQIYFNEANLVFTPKLPNTKEKKEFLRLYFIGLMKQYFASHPTSYSNWELNAKFMDKHTFPRVKNKAFLVINFPQIMSGIKE